MSCGADDPARRSARSSDIQVGASRNPQGLSPYEWVTTPRAPGSQPLSTHQTVERMTINGLEAVRLVEDNARAATMSFVISANDRIYTRQRADGSGSRQSLRMAGLVDVPGSQRTRAEPSLE